MKKWATALLLAVALVATSLTAHANPAFVGGGNDESSEDMSNTVAGTAWNAAAGTAATPGTVAMGVTGTHLLVTEVGWRGPNGATAALADSSEFIEIYNPTSCTIDLSGVYLSDVNGYSALPVTGTVDIAASGTDFAMKFPNGSSIAPGQVLVIAIDGGRYQRATGTDANYQFFNAGGTTSAVSMTDVAGNKPGVYPSFGMFTNGGEFVWLFYWDGATDLVTDFDLVYWGPGTGANLPTRKLASTCQDGPDVGSATSCYNLDAGNPAGSLGKALAAPASGAGTRQRLGAESEAIASGSNGALLGPADIVVTSDLNPAECNATIKFFATVVGANSTGTVSFFDGLSLIGATSPVGDFASISVPVTGAGAHSITASYSGGTCAGAGTSPAFIQTIDPSPSSTLLSSDVNPSVCGQKVTLTATITPSDASGTVSFYDGANVLGTAAVGSGTATLSVTDLGAGGHSLSAVYGGGGCAAASTSPELIQTVDPAPSAVTVTSDVNPSVCGDKVNFTATVTPMGATGSVTFMFGPDVIATLPVDAAGEAKFSAMAELYSGKIAVTAQYSGDACHAAALSPEYSQVVTPATPVLTLASEQNPSDCGVAFGLNATITPAFVIGDLEFFDGATSLGTAAVDGLGHASLVVTLTGAGVHTLTVKFAGDYCTDAGSSPDLLQQVNVATTPISLGSNTNPSLCGQQVKFTAQVPAGSTGTVTFYDGATLLEVVPVDALGTARHSTTTLSIGKHVIAAEYSGDACHGAVRSADLSQVVDLVPTETALSSSPNPSACGAKVTLTATVTTPLDGGNGLVAKQGAGSKSATYATGTVTFYADGNPIGSATLDAAGVATLSVTTLTGGFHSLNAGYDGDGCNGTSVSAPLAHTVTGGPTSTTVSSDVNPSMCGQKVNLSATVSPSSATGTVTFYDGGDALGTVTLDAFGSATLSATFPGQPPIHTITATYNGDDCNAASTSSPYDQRVDQLPTTTVVTSDANPVKFGAKLNLTATITSNLATGVVVFYDGANFLGQATVGSGAATLSVTTLGVGSHDITATYNGDDCYAPSASPIYAQVVVPDNPPAVTVIYPNGGENLLVGMTYSLTWTAGDDNNVESVSLYVSRDYGATYETLATDIPNSGSFSWLVTPPGTNTYIDLVYSCLFKVIAKDNVGQYGQDTSDNYFSIFDPIVEVVLTRLDAEAGPNGIAIKWALQNPLAFTSLSVERAEAEAGPWNAIETERHDEGGVMVAVDGTAAPAKSYWYRLVGQTLAGSRAVFGPVKGTAAAPASFALSPAWPNPARGAMHTQFSLPRDASIRLSIVDLQGREVQVLADGHFAAGRYQASWDGRTERGPAPGGIYFIRYVTPDRKLTQRLVIAR